MLAMRWEDLDLEQGVWRIPHTKAGLPPYLPLPQPVVTLLKGLPRILSNPHVFPG